MQDPLHRPSNGRRWVCLPIRDSGSPKAPETLFSTLCYTCTPFRKLVLSEQYAVVHATEVLTVVRLPDLPEHHVGSVSTNTQASCHRRSV